jgi:hypothetical protein
LEQQVNVPTALGRGGEVLLVRSCGVDILVGFA